jgi:hypothetical protein
MNLFPAWKELVYSGSFVLYIKQMHIVIWLYAVSDLSASQYHVWVFPLLPERQQKLRTQIVYNGLPEFLGRLLYAYLHPLLGADELSG